jgi:hypothetical protein
MDRGMSYDLLSSPYSSITRLWKREIWSDSWVTRPPRHSRSVRSLLGWSIYG